MPPEEKSLSVIIACSATPTEENYTCEVFFVFNFFVKQGLGWP